MAILSQILVGVLQTFYTFSAMDLVGRSGASGTHLVLQLAKPVQLKLKEWLSALPPCLKMDSSRSSSLTTKLCATRFLHLAYFATKITLHQRIVCSLSQIPCYICDAVVERRNVANLSLLDQWRQLVLGPLSRLEQSHQSYVLIIDALDECEGDENVWIILQLLAEA